MEHTLEEQFVLCINNEGYSASLERRRVYPVVPDPQASGRHLLRVVDESGEDYFYPAECFVPIRLPEAALRAFAQEA